MYKPGQSGNPGGRSRVQAEFETKCRKFMEEKGWVALEEMAQDKDKKVKQWALEQMMNRGFGKAKETIDVTTRDESLQSPDSIADRISDLIGRKEGGGVGDSIPGGGTA